MTRKRKTSPESIGLRGGALLAALALLLAACGGDGGDTDTGTEADEPAATDTESDDTEGETAAGGTAIIAIGEDPPSLNPAISTGYAEGEVGSKVFEGLVWIDGNYEAQPALAESWDISDDGTIYTFNLREGVEFHDGTPLTSEDVRFSFEEVLGVYHSRMTPTMEERVEGIETPDESTVIFTLQEPFAPFLQQLDVYDGAILPAHIYGESDDVLESPANNEPVGTGPFRFASWDRGSAVILERNDNYWDNGLPYLDGVAFQIIPQANARAIALETGEIDWVSGFYLPETDFDSLEAADNVRLEGNVGIPALYFMAMNTESEVLADAEVRRAVAQAIDRERILEQAVDGFGRVGYGPFGDGFDWISSAHPGYAASFEYDPDAAREVISEAGFEGETLTIVVDSARADLTAAANIIADNLSEIGLAADLQLGERAVMVSQVYGDSDFDLTLQSFTSLGDPVLGYHRIYASVEPGTQFANPTLWGDEAVDSLFSEAGALPEIDDRAELYAEAAEILIEQMPTLILYEEDSLDGMNAALVGYHAAADSRGQWGQVRFDE